MVRDAIADTIVALQLRKSGTNKKKKRVNIADKSSEVVDVSNEEVAVVSKSPRTLEVLKKVLQEHFLLKSLRDINPIMSALQMHVALPGEVIVWQVNTYSLMYSLTHSLTHSLIGRIW